MPLNSKGEVADFQSVSQFGGWSAYECVAFSAALIFYAGQPGRGPTGTVQQVINLARSWYSRLEGNDLPSNQNGMSLQALYTMLQGMKLKHYPLQPDMTSIKKWLSAGYPVIIAGDETGMYDVGIGDRIPYAWKPTGNHAIIATGIARDGNLLVQDPANIGPAGLRPEPRTYDISKMHLISATAVALPFSSNNPVVSPSLPQQQNGDTLHLLQLTDPMGQFFSEVDAHTWHCKPTNVNLIYAHLDFFRKYEGIFGLPLTNEIYLAQFPHTAIVVYERAVAIYDPSRRAPNEAPPGASMVYLMHINNGTGQQIIAKPLLVELQKQVADLQAQIGGYQNQLSQLEAELTNKPDVSALQTQLTTAQAQIREYANQLADRPDVTALNNRLASYQAAIQQVDAIVDSLNAQEGK